MKRFISWLCVRMYAYHDEGLTLRQAALIAGIGMLIMTGAAPLAEYFVFPKLVFPGNIEQTARRQSLFIDLPSTST
jgi:hypothetical protein